MAITGIMLDGPTIALCSKLCRFLIRDDLYILEGSGKKLLGEQTIFSLSLSVPTISFPRYNSATIISYCANSITRTTRTLFNPSLSHLTYAVHK